jgi:hypothetical protein
MTYEEVAQLLDISITTAKEDWVFSRAWPFDEIEGDLNDNFSC